MVVVDAAGLGPGAGGVRGAWLGGMTDEAASLAEEGGGAGVEGAVRVSEAGILTSSGLLA